jgi:diaminohydroxyphosphoribosylaminopyrimidine deaminase/5-amino-6-(5-phosphoribosylamino)uracil reductase
MIDAVDRAHLGHALDLAERGARTAAPNPIVGCVLVREGVVVGEGWHEHPGGPHAEAVALAAAGGAARGATAYVSLEPCAHHGRTPPCADALLAAGVARVVVAAGDPTDKVDGRGLRRLSDGGVLVDVLAESEPLARRARRQTAPFRTHGMLGRPHVTYKAAATLDGRTAARAGDSRWISSPESRALVHEWRARAGAVLVGSGTALRDDPLLTARDLDPPAVRQPLRVVWDRRARLEPSSRLAGSTDQGPVLVLVAADAPSGRRTALEAAGVETHAVRDVADGLSQLAARGVTSVLCEGGATLAGALLAAGALDRVALFVAPVLLGDAAAPGVLAGLAPATMADALRATAVEATASGPDVLLDAWLREP